jgi:SAM-dependent methyltransferase
MSRICLSLSILVVVLGASCASCAADYLEGLAPPGAPASAFPAPSRPIARIVTDTWKNEQSRDQASEAGRVMDLLGVKPGMTVADIGAGSGYYTVRLARRIGPTGHIYAEDVVPDYLERLAQRVRSEGLTGVVTLVRGDSHDPRLPSGSLDLALLVHMYHEVQQPYGLLWNLRPELKPDAKVGIIDARKQTASHGTPPHLLRCELLAVSYRQTAFYDLQEDTYLAVFASPAAVSGSVSPADIRPCTPGRG